jgi:DNA sulfur modification protein DndB
MRHERTDMTVTTLPAASDPRVVRAVTGSDFEYTFPAIKGVQAGREFFTSMCPLRLIPKLFLFDEVELMPELRAQRTLNRARIPEIAQYISGNPTSYTFSALTASINADVVFVPHDEDPHRRVGLLRVPMDAKFVINDGQHRRAAIEAALQENPSLGDESIAVVFFLDAGLKRCQQMFADLNRHAVRPSKSIGVLYDHRDRSAAEARLLIMTVPLFAGMVEVEASSLAKRSRKLFTLSSVFGASRALLEGIGESDAVESSMVDEDDPRVRIARTFWETLGEQFPEWSAVRAGTMHAVDVRTEFLHTHSIVLTALGRIGNTLLREREGSADWIAPLRDLHRVDWRRANTALWEGRAMVGGRVSKAAGQVLLTTAVIRSELGLPLPEEERAVLDCPSADPESI